MRSFITAESTDVCKRSSVPFFSRLSTQIGRPPANFACPIIILSW
jgi:hypothetical protein